MQPCAVMVPGKVLAILLMRHEMLQTVALFPFLKKKCIFFCLLQEEKKKGKVAEVKDLYQILFLVVFSFPQVSSYP